jgi:hypothetical protein
MLSNSRRAAVRKGVLPRLTTCFDPRTACAGLSARTWPMTSQSNSIRTAARCCFTVGLATVLERLDIGGDVQRLDADELVDAVRLEPGKEMRHAAVVGRSGVFVANGGGEEFEEAPRGVLAGVGDDRRYDEIGAAAGLDRKSARWNERHLAMRNVETAPSNHYNRDQRRRRARKRQPSGGQRSVGTLRYRCPSPVPQEWRHCT